MSRRSRSSSSRFRKTRAVMLSMGAVLAAIGCLLCMIMPLLGHSRLARLGGAYLLASVAIFSIQGALTKIHEISRHEYTGD